jgi:excinuclease ABC subunit C
MREIVYRRYKHLVDENSELPNLIIADGGIGQMRAIREATEQQLGLNIPIAGLVKDNKHRTSTLLFGEPPVEIGMKPTDELFHFLTQIQDEVHRFAITYHKQKRSKTQTASELDNIKGIGEKTKNMLLKHFGSVKRLKEAKLADLIELIGNSKGSIVYNYFNNHLSR